MFLKKYRNSVFTKISNIFDQIDRIGYEFDMKKSSGAQTYGEI